MNIIEYLTKLNFYQIKAKVIQCLVYLHAAKKGMEADRPFFLAPSATAPNGHLKSGSWYL